MMHPLTMLAVLLLGARLAAQPSAPVPAQAPPPAPAPARLPAGVVLGQRAASLDRAVGMIPIVEIAPDSGAYLDALSRWSVEQGIWPVLIDDGTDRAREDIARFVRAFVPRKVVRLPAGGRVDPEELEARSLAAVRRTWNALEGQLLEVKWKEFGFAPAGVVAANAVDPAWTAAVALSAARGQPLVWFLAPLGAPGGQVEATEVHAIDAQVRDALAKTPWTYAALGDNIDALTFCASLGGRVVNEPGAKGPLALTDVLGRLPSGRWAWAGWIFGTESSAAYTAMCSVFLRPDSAWLFDSYGSKFPPEYASRTALPMLERIGFPVTLTEPEGGTVRTWRGRCEGGIDGALVQVNTMGHFNWFKLIDANAWASEVPMLLRPAMVSFTHSFSAQYINAPSSISGRWLDEGAYGYIGAVDEPNLGAFVPPNVLFSRILAGGAWGYASRIDDAPAWKVQVFGDPLATIGPKRRVGEVPLGLVTGAHALDDIMKFQLESKKLADAAASLVMLGRDADAVRLARAVVADAATSEADKIAIARVGIYPAFRAKDPGLFVALYALLPPEVAARDGHRALLWQILRPALESDQADEAAVTVLMANTRPESVLDDAAAIRASVARIFGSQAARKMYLRLAAQAPDDATRQALERAAGPG